MKVSEKVEMEAVTDVLCDVCLCSTRATTGGLEFATLQALWGYGAQHDGDRYELHLCESCFFGTLAYLKQERRIQNLVDEEGDAEEGKLIESFGLVAKDVYFNE